MLKIIQSKSLKEKFSGKEDIVSFGQCPLLQYIFAVYYYSVFPQYIPTGYFHSICPVYSNSSFPQYVFTGYFQEADRSSQHFPWKVLWLALGLGSIILAVLLLSVLLGNLTNLFSKLILKFIWFHLSQSLPNLLEVYLFLAQACTAGEGEGLRNMWFLTCDWKHFKHVIENSWKMWLKTLDMSLKTFKTCYYNHSKHVIENTSNMCYRYLSWNASNGNMDVVNKIYVTEM